MALSVGFTFRGGGIYAAAAYSLCYGLLWGLPEAASSECMKPKFEGGWVEGISAPQRPYSSHPRAADEEDEEEGRGPGSSFPTKPGEMNEEETARGGGDNGFDAPYLEFDGSLEGGEGEGLRGCCGPATTATTLPTSLTTTTTTIPGLNPLDEDPHPPPFLPRDPNQWDSQDPLPQGELWLSSPLTSATTSTTTSPTRPITATATPRPISLNPRYPTRIVEVEGPSPEDRQRCRLWLPVSAITRGESPYLLRGNWGVFVESGEVVVHAFSEKEEGAPLGFGSRLWRLLRSMVYLPLDFYTFRAPLPNACIYSPTDPTSGSAAVGAPEKLSHIVVQLTPDAHATYLPSPSTPPVTPVFADFGWGKFKHLGHCLFGMNVISPVEPESLTFSASARTAAVERRAPYGGPPFRLETLHIPCSCSPERLGLISWWVGRGPLGGPFVLLYVGYDGEGPRRAPDKCKDERIHKVSLPALDGPVNYAEVPFYKKTQ
ncbi:hypothetical protein, conserved [Eimeria brunetti]|uniref:Uncharacterized protein n=1 Tax=Eimeria brunetti TaxID=51314 RepID=U6LQF4_9EIME|nr:hypothetical protein, conserved [Eimeria brunetti]